MQHQQPTTIDVKGLSELLHRKPSTILSDLSRHPERVPPSIKPEGTRTRIWLFEDVIAWLKERQSPLHSPATQVARRGPSLKEERVRRRSGAR